MRKATHYARTSALPAIAAALALTSTHAFAQEAQPVTPPPAEPAPTVSAEPAPTIETAPVTPDTTVATPDSSATPAPVKSKRTATRATPVATHTVAQKVTTKTTHAAVPAAVAPAPVAAAPAAPVATKPALTPIVDTTPKPAAPQTAAKPAPTNGNDTALELGGGALALLALGAGAYALSRRRRHEDEEFMDETYEPETAVISEPVVEPRHDPIAHEEPAMIAPEVSAFAWGNSQPAAQPAEDDESDRLPGESWVERAYRGPSPANPSVSLRARLKRAAFFDKREREVAQGTAEPVEADAGLPEAMVEEQAEEREHA
jgi:hypothetical protein